MIRARCWHLHISLAKYHVCNLLSAGMTFAAEHMRSPEDPSGVAYVAMLLRSHATSDEMIQPYIADALVLGASLDAHCMEKTRVLLVTEDVMDVAGAHLLNVHWKVQVIQPIILDPSSTTRCEDCFEGDVNKIQIFDPKQLNYRKVV